MRSNLLEEAIVDAEALKEAALKSAQEAVLEQYAPEVKKAIKIILEQEMMPDTNEEDPLSGLNTDSIPDLGMNPTSPDNVSPDGAEPSQAVKKLPMAATEGEKLCACPDEDEEVEINFDELEKQMSADAKEENTPDVTPETNPNDQINLKIQEDIELDEDLIRELMSEELEADEVTTEGQIEEEDNLQEVEYGGGPQEQSLKETKRQRDLKENNSRMVVSKNVSLIKENKQLLSVRRELLEENKRIKKAVFELTKRLEEINISNAKLLYTNQALTSNSLNERQKQKIVEAISKAESVDDVKLIYETLQHTVGSVTKPKEPKSLNEVVQNKGGLIFPRREKESSNNPVYTRMQKIAGITK